jgi:formylglycine-generating enzyme required for sulfatase activity
MLTDFGLVKIFENKGSTNLTESGAGLGTPDYMAPEQWTGDSTAQSDQYSLGVVLYEMITAHRPYISDTPAGILLKQINEPLPLPKKYIPDLPLNVESVLLKVLARKQENRYPDMRSFANELQDLLDGREVNATTIKTKVLREQMTGMVERKLQANDKLPAQNQAVQGRSTAPPSALRKRKFPVFLMVIFGVFAILFVCGSCWFINANFGLFAVTRTPTREVLISFTSTNIPPTEIIRATINPTATPVPVETSLPTEIEDDKSVPMRLVSAGKFTMGNDNGDTESRPASSIYVETFYIDKYEVTNDMYGICVSDGKCRMPKKPGSATRSSYFNNPNFANYPAIYVDWKMAKTYCEWRGARLPTEAEWEKAARGSDDERAFPWGDNFDCDFANHSGCVGDTAPVSQYDKGQSPYGVYGMSGNVWEWTSSLFSFYPYSSTDGRENLDVSGNRVVRGGSWNIFGGTGGNIRIDTRFKLDPVYFGPFVGIRCALTK